jgi:hypothetical protein
MTMELAEAQFNTGRNPNAVRATAIYYRKPENWGKEGGWIFVGDGHPYRRIEYMSRGCTVVLNGLEVTPSKPWDAILRHPDGPKQFPAQQVIENYWYRYPPVPGVRFPSLHGMTVHEVECPACTETRFFHDPRHAALHLQNDHKWDIASIIAYGKEVDVDFNEKVKKAGKIVYSFQASDEPDPGPWRDTEGDLDPAVQIVAPQKAKEDKTHQCPECGQVFPIALALAGHRRTHNG